MASGMQGVLGHPAHDRGVPGSDSRGVIVERELTYVPVRGALGVPDRWRTELRRHMHRSRRRGLPWSSRYGRGGCSWGGGGGAVGQGEKYQKNAHLKHPKKKENYNQEIY